MIFWKKYVPSDEIKLRDEITGFDGTYIPHFTYLDSIFASLKSRKTVPLFLLCMSLIVVHVGSFLVCLYAGQENIDRYPCRARMDDIFFIISYLFLQVSTSAH
jgi:hypothetical protein